MNIQLVDYDKEKLEKVTFIKICVNKAHMGPINNIKAQARNVSKLCASANKIRVRADLTVAPIGDQTTEGKHGKLPSNYTKVIGFESSDTLTSIDIASEAVYLFQAWDMLYAAKAGTPDYVKKATEFIEAQSKFYNSIGINPASGKKPELTMQQKQAYNASVGPYGFDYYEYHLAFKLEGESKFTRSATYRTLERLGLANILKPVCDEYSRLHKKLRVVVKFSN